MVGSSRKRTRGRWTRAAASSHFMRSPSDRRARRLLHEVAELEELRQLAHRLLVLRPWHAVDRAIELEGLARRQVPEELLLLPEDEHDLLEERVLAATRLVAVDGDLAARRMQQPREDLERRRLARAVRAEKAHALARCDVEVDAVDGGDGLVGPAEDRAERGGDPRGALVDLVVLPEAADPDHGLLELREGAGEGEGHAGEDTAITCRRPSWLPFRAKGSSARCARGHRGRSAGASRAGKASRGTRRSPPRSRPGSDPRGRAR